MTKYDVSEVRNLLEELRVLLAIQGERNWIRGVNSVIAELDNHEGVERARSIYSTLYQGNGSFSDFHIWVDDFDQRLAANKELDRLRARVWEAFNL